MVGERYAPPGHRLNPAHNGGTAHTPAGAPPPVAGALRWVTTSVARFDAHDVWPLAFNIKLALGGGYAFERACGSAQMMVPV